MPNLLAHRQMGAQVLARLSDDMTIDPGVFTCALSGPDDWACYRFYLPPLWRAFKGRSRIMHTARTGAFLDALAEQARAADGAARLHLFSYAAGFYCHFALDSHAHPGINAQCEKTHLTHAAVERELDCALAARSGLSISHALLTLAAPPPLPQDMAAGLERAYSLFGWQNVLADLDRASRDARRLDRLLADPRSVLRTLFFWCAPVKERLYSCGAQGMELTAFDVQRQAAVVEAVAWIEQVFRYVYCGGTGVQTPQRSYLTGLVERED